MTTNQHLSGTSIITIETGQRLGTIEQIVLEPDGRKIAAFTVQSGSGGGMLTQAEQASSWLLMSDVHAVGPDAVTVTSSDCLQETIERRDYLLASDLIRRKIVTEGGALIGDVASIHFDPQSLDVTGFEISKGLFKGNEVVDVSHLVTVGNDLIIVDDSTSAEESDTTESTSAGETNENVVGDVTTGNQPGKFQVVRKALNGDDASQQ